MENSEIYTSIVTFLSQLLNSKEISDSDCRNVYSTIIKVQFDNCLNNFAKIQTILEECTEYVLQKLWFHIVKPSHCNDIIHVFQNEVFRRKSYAHWCLDVYNYDLEEDNRNDIFDNLPSTSSCKLFYFHRNIE